MTVEDVEPTTLGWCTSATLANYTATSETTPPAEFEAAFCDAQRSD